MKPQKLTTKIFLDGGDPHETREILALLGFLDGQTTNPTLIAKNPEANARLERGEKFSEQEIYDFYRGVVKAISSMIPNGSVSIEVYSDKNTLGNTMYEQGKAMYKWIPNAHIKLPCTVAGIATAQRMVQEGIRVNMTLCFSQAQAAAVYGATQGAHKGQVFVSPFVGRLDDKGENGMDLIKNILQMYRARDGDAGRPQSHAQRGGHVEVLTASVRTMEHFMYALALKSDIITAPGKILREWAEKGMPSPTTDYTYDAGGLKPIPYQDIDLTKAWAEYNLAYTLTDVGIEKFAADWNALIKK